MSRYWLEAGAEQRSGSMPALFGNTTATWKLRRDLDGFHWTEAQQKLSPLEASIAKDIAGTTYLLHPCSRWVTGALVMDGGRSHQLRTMQQRNHHPRFRVGLGAWPGCRSTTVSRHHCWVIARFLDGGRSSH